MELSALRFAVADGASETSFAKEWAELLVARFIAAPPQPADLRAWVEPMQATWAQSHLEKPAAWYAEQKARDGAFSSLLGLAIEDDKWRALAVGDSCLFVVRGGRLQQAFPFERAEQFNNSPVLLSSIARANADVWSGVQATEGELRAKDQLLLMTDALAQWFLVEAELGRRPWAALDKVATPEAFAELMQFLRRGGALRNDDVTLVRLEVAA